MRIGILLLFFVFGAVSLKAQHKNLNTKKDLEILKSSEEKIIEIKVLKDRRVMMLNVSCNAYMGSIMIEIYDPKGEKKEKFSVKSHQNNSKATKKKGIVFSFTLSTKSASGMIDKVFHKPLEGIWKIKVMPQKASGHVSVSANQR